MTSGFKDCNLVVPLVQAFLPVTACCALRVVCQDCLTCIPFRRWWYPRTTVVSYLEPSSAVKLAQRLGMKPKDIFAGVTRARNRARAANGLGSAFFYFLLNKPSGTMSQRCQDASGRQRLSVYDVLPSGSKAYPHVPHVGRLDFETEGLLCFTDDGHLANALLNAAYHAHTVMKRYLVETPGCLDNDQSITTKKATTTFKNGQRSIVITAHQIEQLALPLRYPDGKVTTPATVRVLHGRPLALRSPCKNQTRTTATSLASQKKNLKIRCQDGDALASVPSSSSPTLTSTPSSSSPASIKPNKRERKKQKRLRAMQAQGSVFLEIGICEGRNRQIRRLCKRSGLHVTRLMRISMGPLCIEAMPCCAVRSLTQAEVVACYQSTGIAGPVPSVLPLAPI